MFSSGSEILRKVRPEPVDSFRFRSQGQAGWFGETVPFLVAFPIKGISEKCR